MTALTAQLSALHRMVEQWPRDWRPALGEDGDWFGCWNCMSRRDGDADQVSADVDEDYAVDLAKFVASLVNAAPVLLEIAQAALAWRTARMVPGIAAEREAAHALIAALEGTP